MLAPESGESNKEMIYGICGKKSQRDNMKSKHFPKVYPGKPYLERSDSQSMFTFLTATKRIASGDENMDSSEAPVETALDLVQSDEEETFEENPAGNKIIKRGIKPKK